jgi:hypothetical protein
LADYIALLNSVGLVASSFILYQSARIYLGRITPIGAFLCFLAFATALCNIGWFLLFWAMAAET